MALRLSLSRPAPLIATITASAIGVGVLSKMMFSTASAESNTPQKIFKGGITSVKLPLHSSEYESHDTKRLRFKLPRETDITGLPLSSAVLTFTWPEGSWLPTPRPYSPISPADEPGYMDLLVKKYPNGKGSTYLHSLQPGDTLFFLGSKTDYAWKPNAFPKITLIAGGCGITPIFQLIQGILRNPDDKTNMTLVFGAKSDEDILLRKELDGIAKEFPDRLKVRYTVGTTEEGSGLRRGRVDGEFLKEVLGEEREGKVFVCGPKGMEDALVGGWGSGGWGSGGCGSGGWGSGGGILRELGFKKSQIYKFS